MSEFGLSRKIDAMLKQGNRLQSKAEALMPLVVGGFNKYVEHVVNPRLPTGAEIQTTTEAYYSYPYNGINIAVGRLEVPSDMPDEGVSMAKQVAVRLCEEYKGKLPGINMVECSRIYREVVRDD